MTIKAVGLISGGLDSTLAARVLLDQGIEVVGLHLYTGLCITEHKRRLGTHNAKGEVPQNPAFAAADRLGISLEILDISETYLDVIARPRHGRGSGANPCRDCRIHMFEHAFRFMDEIGAKFVFTGEVLGQRPMSQVRRNRDFIHGHTGRADLILNPLSARLHPPTLPEREGWVDRERLLAIEGRSRKPQIALARELGIEEYEAPAGGCCFLTDEAYSRKFLDMLKFDPQRRLDMEDIVLLGVGRHFRLNDRLKIVVGRDENENAVLRLHAARHYQYEATSMAGPLTVALGVPDAESDMRIASIVARYAAGESSAEVEIRKRIGESAQLLHARPARMQDFEAMRL